MRGVNGQSAQPERSRSRTRSQSVGLRDDTDLALLRALRRDARATVAALATECRISRANAYARLARLRETGVIEGFTVRLDPARLGLEVTALVTLSVDQRDWRAVRDELAAIPEVAYVAMATGAFDFLLLVRVPDVQTLRDILLERLQAMPQVRSTQTSFVLDEVVSPTPLPTGPLLETQTRRGPA
jgi:DNA-binding Lrp family transcriptional regulator